ncbi:MAG: VOC family protein [bacterium]
MRKFLLLLPVFVLIAASLGIIYSLNKNDNDNENFNILTNEVMFKKITPNLMVADVNATVDYYKSNFDFQILMGVDEGRGIKTGDPALEAPLTWAMIKKDDIEIMLQRADNFIEELPELNNLKIGGTFTLYVSMQNTKDFYEKIKNNVEIVKPIHKTFYGTDEFVVKDLNGYIIYFAEAQNG